jgi:hypothetical protein
VKEPGVVQVLSFIGDLQAGAPHSEAHRVHIYLSGIRLLCCCHSQVCVYIWINWNQNFNFLASPLSDGGHQSLEARMRVHRVVNDELGLRKLVKIFKLSFVLFYSLEQFWVLDLDMVLGAQHRRTCHCGYRETAHYEVIFQVLASIWKVMTSQLNTYFLISKCS